MQYGKTLIVLSGDYGKRALTVETTARGSVGSTAVFGKGERLYLAVKQGNERFVKILDGKKIEFPFVVNESAHFIVVRGDDLAVVLYGTASEKKMWRGNMLDGVRVEIEKMEIVYREIAEKAYGKTVTATAEKIVEAVEYDDEQIARDNYYPKRFVAKKEGVFTGSFYKDFVHESGVSGKIGGFLSGFNAKLKGETEVKPHSRISYLQKRHLKGLTSSVRAASSDPEKQALNLLETKPKKDLSSDGKKIRSTTTFGKTAERVDSVKTDFYERVKTKLSKLFEAGESFPLLEKAMPLTRWVRVAYERSYYVVGIIGDKPDFVCYGVPGRFAETAPSDLDGYARWFPLDPTKPQGDGLWLMYQDARTGDTVRL